MAALIRGVQTNWRTGLGALRLLRALAVSAFFAALTLAIFLPVYTDEVGWRFQERAGFDGLDKMYNDSCGRNSLAKPVWFMWPARWFSALLNGAYADPLYVRLSGIGYAMLSGVLLARVIRRSTCNPKTRAALGAIGFGLLALANTPLILVLSRPEQPILLCAAMATLIALPHADHNRSSLTGSAGAWTRALGAPALAAIALSYHLKALVLIPLFLACALLSGRGRLTLLPRLIATGAILAMTALAARYWMVRLRCPDDTLLRAEYARNSVGAMLGNYTGFAGTAVLLKQLFANIDVSRYVLSAAPEPSPLSFWLPNGQVTSPAAIAWGRVLLASWALALALGAVAFANAAWMCWRARRFDKRLVIVLALIAAPLGWSSTQLITNFYEAAFVLPLLVLAIVVSLATDTSMRSLPTVILASIISLAAPLSVALITLTWAPSLWSAWGQSGYVAGQPFSLAVRGYEPVARRVLAAAHACRLPPPARAHGLVLDELTYFPYMRAQLPQHWLGVFGGWKGSITDPVKYLNSRGSDGILVACRHLPPHLLVRARAVGEVCCLSPPGW